MLGDACWVHDLLQLAAARAVMKMLLITAVLPASGWAFCLVMHSPMLN